MESKKGFFSDWPVHVMCLGLVLIAEFIGRQPFEFESIGLSFALLPMLYVLVIGMIAGIAGLIKKEYMETAAPYIGISVMLLSAKMGSSIGPNIKEVISAGPALILQELGNLGTIFLAVPVAVFVFKMGRQAVGAGFSISREGSLAIVGDLYGLSSPEGQGVMGAYITGTLFGTIFNGIMVSLLLGLNIFHPYALAMAAGTGSTSMMAAAVAPILDAYSHDPEMASTINALATTSQVLTTADGLYMSLFVAIPVTNWLYKALKGEERHAAHQAKKEAKRAGKGK